jgi:hypothetical protein
MAMIGDWNGVFFFILVTFHLCTASMKRSFLVAHDFDIIIFFLVYFNWEELKWLQICKFLIEIIFILFLDINLFYYWCQTLKNRSASFLCIHETYFISMISQFESD